jgi:hypothetical protein
MKSVTVIWFISLVVAVAILSCRILDQNVIIKGYQTQEACWYQGEVERWVVPTLKTPGRHKIVNPKLIEKPARG